MTYLDVRKCITAVKSARDAETNVRKSLDGKFVTSYSAMTVLESAVLEYTDITSFKNDDL